MRTASRPSLVVASTTQASRPPGSSGPSSRLHDAAAEASRSGTVAIQARASSPPMRATNARKPGWTTSPTALVELVEVEPGGAAVALRSAHSSVTRASVCIASRSRPPLQRASERKTCKAASSGYSSAAPRAARSHRRAAARSGTTSPARAALAAAARPAARARAPPRNTGSPRPRAPTGRTRRPRRSAGARDPSSVARQLVDPALGQASRAPGRSDARSQSRTACATRAAYAAKPSSRSGLRSSP